MRFSCFIALSILDFIAQMIKKWLFWLPLLVLSPQPVCNLKKTLNQKRLFLQLIIEDEVVGLTSLLLKTRK
jgi:hypothetical protein